MRIIAFIQAVYFIATGVWPIVHMRSFLAFTGPKTDLWLVKCVGILVIAIGMALLLAAWRDEISATIIILAIASAAGLCAIDIIHVAKRVIPKIYLTDAAAEIALIVAWLIAWDQR